MNDKIIQANTTPKGCKKGRRICMTRGQQDDMTMCFWGTRVFYKINGRDNFGINRMMDKNGSATSPSSDS